MFSRLFANTYTSLTTVRFQGTVFALACDSTSQTIYYRVLLAGNDAETSADLWSPSAALEFPCEIRAAGVSLLTLASKLAYPGGTVKPGSPFSAVADDTHVYIFRTSTNDTILVDRFLVIESAGEGQTKYTLSHAWEVRYQRSENRDLPATPHDTFGYRSLDGQPFIEPTIDLGALVTVPTTGYCVALVPGPAGAATRWLIATTEAGSSPTLAWTLFDRGSDGLFHPTSKKPKSITLTGFTQPSAPSALVYSQHEELPSPLAEGAHSLKRSVHLLLAWSAQTSTPAQALVLLDIAVGANGELGEVPDPLTLQSLDNGALPLLAHEFGLPVSGAIVTAADPVSSVCLLESGDGLVHIYYQSTASGRLSVVQFQPLIDRAVYFQAIGDSSKDSGFYFTAHYAGINPGANPITIQQTAQPGYGVARCDLVMSLNDPGKQDLDEKWTLLPTRIEEIVEILSGRASYLVADDDDVIERRTAFFNYGPGGKHVRPMYAYQQANSVLLWFVIRGYTTTIQAANTAFLVNVTTRKGKAVLMLACSVTFVEGEETTTYQEVWLDIPLQTNPSLEGIAAVLNGKAMDAGVKYDYGHARYYCNGVPLDSIDLANGSQLFTALAPVPGGFPTTPSISARGSSSTPLEYALPLTGSVLSFPATVCPLGQPDHEPPALQNFTEGSFTVEAWFSTTASRQVMSLVSFGDGTGNAAGLFLGLNPVNGGLQGAAFVFSPPYGTQPAFQLAVSGPPDATLNDGAWHHIALTYDSKAQSGRVYVDGVGGTPGSPGAPTIPPPPLNWMYFGITSEVSYNGQASSLPFTGTIGEVRVWTQALEPQELRATWLVPLPENTPGLLARWPINDGSGTSVQGYPSSTIGAATLGQGTWGSPGAAFPAVEQGVIKTSGEAAKLPGSQLYIPSARGISPDEMALNLSNGPLMPASWPASRGSFRLPSLVGETSLEALTLSGANTAVTFGTGKSNFDFLGDLSFEAWINPSTFLTSGVWVQRLVENAATSEEPDQSTAFTVALRNLWAIQLDGTTQWLELSAMPLPSTVTILLRLNMTDPDHKQTIIGKYTADFSQMLRVRWVPADDKGGSGRFMVLLGHGDRERSVAKFPTTLPTTTFVLGIVMQPNPEKGSTTVSCYVNGVLLNTDSISVLVTDLYDKGCGDGDWIVGMDWDRGGRRQSEFTTGTIDEVQLWNVAIDANDPAKRLQMTARLTGDEPNLITYLTLNEGPDSIVAMDRSPSQNHGRLRTTGDKLPGWVMSIWNRAMDYATVMFGGGSRGSRTSGGLPIAANRWSQLSVTYQTNYLIELAGSQRLRCSSQSSLNFDRALTLEAWFQSSGGKRTRGTILSKWGETASQRSYLLQIDDEGRVVFAVAAGQQVAVRSSDRSDGGDISNQDDTVLVLKSKTQLLSTDTWHYVAAIFASEVTGEQARNGSEPYDPNGVRSSVTMSIFVDGKLDASLTLPPPSGNEATNAVAGAVEIRRSSADVVIGGVASPPEVGLLDHARLAELRAWKRALDAETIHWVWRNGLVPNDQQDLVAYWAIDEGEGLVVHDRVGGNDAASTQPLTWDHSKLGAIWRLYVDGVEDAWTVALPALDASESAKSAAGQSLCARFAAGSQSTECFNGYVAEIRAWKSTRTPVEIELWQRTRIAPTADGLVGYWPVTAKDTTTLRDWSVTKNDGTLLDCGPVTVSTLPLRNELEFVSNALGQPGTGEPDKITGPPSVIEYGGLVFGTDGHVIGGLMKRIYTFPMAKGSYASEDLVVGSLRATFLGQVQFAPTLAGYIEGPPPVPSENLTRPFWNSPYAYLTYNGASTVNLISNAKTRFAVAASRDESFKMSMSYKLSLYADVKHISPILLFGIPMGETYVQAKGELGNQSKLEHSRGWISSASQSSSTAWSRKNSLDLRGRWEAPLSELSGHHGYPKLGRRFLPSNVGYALVRSGTADVFALTLEQTGSLVAYQMAPHPDIPEDWNVITFPIDRRYIENGVLDGHVGFWPVDPPTPSYFRVVEAYRLKRAVERETNELAMYHEQFDAGELGRSGNALSDGDGADTLSDAEPPDLSAGREGDPPRRSLVNTYVWTANGGLYAEEMQALSTWEESSGGNYDFTGQSGLFGGLVLGAGVKFAKMWEASVEVRASFETLFGGQLKTQVTKTRGGESALELHVGVIGDPWLHRWDEAKQSYSVEPTPGKVDGYRFMTYCLSPSRDHAETFFSRVVDQGWLQRSPDPSARALRAARAAKNGVWRVLHRVTYVSRVAPRTLNDLDRGLPPEDTKTLGATVIDPADNGLLLYLVEQRSKGKLTSETATWARIGAAVDVNQSKLQEKFAWLAISSNWTALRPKLVAWLGAFFGLRA